MKHKLHMAPLCKRNCPRALNYKSLPCVKGGGSPQARRRDCLNNTADLQIIQNDRFTIPHPLRGSSLYRGSLIEFAETYRKSER